MLLQKTFSRPALIFISFFLLLGIILLTNKFLFNKAPKEINMTTPSENTPGLTMPETPKPPIPTVTTTKIKESEIVTLFPNVPKNVLGLKIILKAFNSKFQNNSGDSHEWIDLEVTKNGRSLGDREFSLSITKLTHPTRTLLPNYSSMGIGDYRFTIKEIIYNFSATILVEKIAK